MDKLAPWLERHRYLIALLLGAFVLHLLLLLPGLLSGNPEAFFSRPDSGGYLDPARALLSDHAYLNAPGGEPHLLRVPGLSVFLAAVFALFGDHAGAGAFWLGTVGVLTAIPVYLAGREWRDETTGLLAAGLFSFYPTVIANRPLLLTDTLFTLLTALALWTFLRFVRRHHAGDFIWTAGLAALGTLVRPINSAWILPLLFVLAITPGVNWRRKLLAGIGGAMLFFALLLPWMARNAALGGGWTLDTNTGAMYHQNGAMLLATVKGTCYEAEKQRILAEVEAEFADHARYPDIKSREAYRIGKFRELIAAHPGVWLRQHFKIQTLLPDFPSLCELLGLTKSDRGTLNVLHQRGLLAAVNHYFDGKLWIPALLAPLLLLPIAVFGGTLWTLWEALRHFRRDNLTLFLFLLFAEYYFFLPGPITVPRYQLPALPLLTVFAAAALLQLGHYLRSRRRRA